MKKCWCYDRAKTLEDKKKAAEQKMKEKQAAKREKAKDAEAKIEGDKTTMKKENEDLRSRCVELINQAL